ncbi:Gamma-1-syntrophin, partial [Sarracenia purpurea var. burkii]
TVKYNVMAGKPRTPAEFRIDWNYGYSLYDTQSNECVWKYRYSQLKGSSDDGISSLKLLFRDEKTGGIETRVSSYFVQLCRIQNYTVQRFP